MKIIHTIRALLFCMITMLSVQSAAGDLKGESIANGKYIRLLTASEQLFTAYLAGPEEARQGILLIHGWWGLNAEVELWADQIAAQGYRVMAIDLYDCHVTKNPVTARKLMNSVIQSEANQKYTAALKLLSVPGRKIAVIGRSYGASQALHAAQVAQDKVSATIIYYPYGELMANKKMLTAIKAPILSHFARDDFFLTPDKVAQFTSAIEESGLTLVVNMYEAKHGFDKPTGKNFNLLAHELAQGRTYRFLNKYLN